GAAVVLAGHRGVHRSAGVVQAQYGLAVVDELEGRVLDQRVEGAVVAGEVHRSGEGEAARAGLLVATALAGAPGEGGRAVGGVAARGPVAVRDASGDVGAEGLLEAPVEPSVAETASA